MRKLLLFSIVLFSVNTQAQDYFRNPYSQPFLEHIAAPIMTTFTLLPYGDSIPKKNIGITITNATWTIKPCPMDTIKGYIYFCDNQSTGNMITKGYFIGLCGGMGIGNISGMDTPDFIPAYFIRNNKMVNGKRQIYNYRHQKNGGCFVDENFKKIPYESVYGLIVKSW